MFNCQMQRNIWLENVFLAFICPVNSSGEDVSLQGEDFAKFFGLLRIYELYQLELAWKGLVKSTLFFIKWILYRHCFKTNGLYHSNLRKYCVRYSPNFWLKVERFFNWHIAKGKLKAISNISFFFGVYNKPQCKAWFGPQSKCPVFH